MPPNSPHFGRMRKEDSRENWSLSGVYFNRAVAEV